jgi:hypothetical protein
MIDSVLVASERSIECLTHSKKQGQAQEKEVQYQDRVVVPALFIHLLEATLQSTVGNGAAKKARRHNDRAGYCYVVLQ